MIKSKTSSFVIPEFAGANIRDLPTGRQVQGKSVELLIIKIIRLDKNILLDLFFILLISLNYSYLYLPILDPGYSLRANSGMTEVFAFGNFHRLFVSEVIDIYKDDKY